MVFCSASPTVRFLGFNQVEFSLMTWKDWQRGLNTLRANHVTLVPLLGEGSRTTCMALVYSSYSIGCLGRKCWTIVATFAYGIYTCFFFFFFKHFILSQMNQPNWLYLIWVLDEGFVAACLVEAFSHFVWKEHFWERLHFNWLLSSTGAPKGFNNIHDYFQLNLEWDDVWRTTPMFRDQILGTVGTQVGGLNVALQDELDANEKMFVGGQHLRYTGTLKFYSPRCC